MVNPLKMIPTVQVLETKQRKADGVIGKNGVRRRPKKPQANVVQERSVVLYKSAPPVRSAQRSGAVTRVARGVRYSPSHQAGAKYVVALHNPFDERAYGAGIPDQFCVPSQKYSVKCVGSFATGTNGIGCLAFRPFQMFASDRKASDNYSVGAIITSNSTSDYADFPAFAYYHKADANAKLSVDAGTNSPYTRASFAADTARSVRLVGASVRIKYVGKVLNSSGSVIVFQNPSLAHSIPAGLDDVAGLMAVQSAYRGQEVPGKVWEMSYAPLAPTDMEPILEPGEYSAINPISQGSMLCRLAGGFAISGTEPGAPYDYEAIAHFEAYGRGLPKTQNVPSIQAVAGAIAGNPAHGSEIPAASRMRAVFDYLGSAFSDPNFWAVVNSAMGGFPSGQSPGMFKTM